MKSESIRRSIIGCQTQSRINSRISGAPFRPDRSPLDESQLAVDLESHSGSCTLSSFVILSRLLRSRELASSGSDAPFVSSADRYARWEMSMSLLRQFLLPSG